MAEPVHFQPEWCRVTLGSIGDAVITTDTEGRVTFLNAVAESLTGWSQQDSEGVPLETVFNIINQESRRTVESPTVRALREGVIVGLANHTLLIAKDGTERPIDDSAAPIRNDQDEVAGVVLIFRDISERYAQEQAIQQSLNFSESVIATLREPFVVLDRQLSVKTANEAFYKTFHAKPEETTGNPFYELGDGQWNIPSLREQLDDVLGNLHSIRDFEVEHDFPSIGHKTVLLNASPVQASDGRPELMLLAIEDVTERRRAELSLRDSEARYRRLFQTARDGILILDAKSMRVIDANPFMTELLGYTHDELMGKELWEIGFFTDRRASKAAYQELQSQGYLRYDHLPLESKTGLSVDVEFICNTYHVDGLEVAQCNIRDIDERSRLERKMQQQSAALADLHRRKDEFLAMLSHELRNPLSPILNAVHMLRLDNDLKPLQLEASGIIERQVGQLTRLVDDLMEVSRISTGRVQLRFERLSANGIVERAIESVRPLIERHHHELTISLSPEPIWLRADATRLEQVVVNLLTNAAKYTADGGRVSISVRETCDECVIRVTDSGVGISPDLLPRIFDIFTQAERSLDRSQGGLGIGLALVQRLVEMHRGRVEVSSSLGEGSDFVVRIPVAPAEGLEPQERPTEMPASNGPSLRVLVVDDNADAAASMAMVVRSFGHNVRTAADGPSAIATASEYGPDLVLLDIGLPKMSGYEVAKRMRQVPNLSGATLVALTGYGQDSDRQRSLESGFDEHLVKPVPLKKVSEILATIQTDGA